MMHGERRSSAALALLTALLVAGLGSGAVDAPSATAAGSGPGATVTTALPSGPQASVEPSSGLVDGQEVEFSATGFPPQAALHLAQCVYTGGPYGRACQGLQRVTSDDAGDVHSTFNVARYVEVGGQGTRDCTQRGCFLGIGPNVNSDHFPDAQVYLDWAVVADPGPPFRPPLPPSADAVYTSLWFDGVVPVATATRTASPVLAVRDATPDHLVFASARRAIYGTGDLGVFVIDLNANRVSPGAPSRPRSPPASLVTRWGCDRISLTPDESLALVTAPDHHELLTIDLVEAEVRRVTRIDGYAEDVAVDPTGRTAWVAVTSGDGSRRLTPVDVASGRRGVPIPIPGNSLLRALAISPDGTRAYVTSSESDEVIPVDLPARTVLPAISMPSSPYDIELTSDGSTAVVTSLWDDTVTVVDLVEHAAGSPIPAEEPRGLDIDDATRTAFVATVGGLTPIDLVTQTAGEVIDLGDGESRDVVSVPAPTAPTPAPTAQPTSVTPRFTG